MFHICILLGVMIEFQNLEPPQKSFHNYFLWTWELIKKNYEDYELLEVWTTQEAMLNAFSQELWGLSDSNIGKIELIKSLGGRVQSLYKIISKVNPVKPKIN